MFLYFGPFLALLVAPWAHVRPRPPGHEPPPAPVSNTSGPHLPQALQALCVARVFPGAIDQERTGEGVALRAERQLPLVDAAE